MSHEAFNRMISEDRALTSVLHESAARRGALFADLTVRVYATDGLYRAVVTGNHSGRSAEDTNVVWIHAVLNAMRALSEMPDDTRTEMSANVA